MDLLLWLLIMLVLVVGLVALIVLRARKTQSRREAEAYAWAAASPVGAGQAQMGNPYQAAVLPDHPKATPSLVLGILGLVGLPFLAPFAWATAMSGRKDVQAMPGRWRATGSLQAGLILGIIGTALLVVGAATAIVLILLLRH